MKIRDKHGEATGKWKCDNPNCPTKDKERDTVPLSFNNNKDHYCCADCFFIHREIKRGHKSQYSVG